MKRIRGGKPLDFGVYEASKTLSWKTLASSVGMAGLLWCGSELVPVLQSAGGYWPLVAACLVPLGTAAYQWLADNTQRKL